MIFSFARKYRQVTRKVTRHAMNLSYPTESDREREREGGSNHETLRDIGAKFEIDIRQILQNVEYNFIKIFASISSRHFL